MTKFGEFAIAPEHFLCDENATHDKIRRAMSDLLWKPDPCDLTLFYFSGHGLQDGYNTGYIAPQDISYDAPWVNGIQMQEIKELVVRARSKTNVVVILDCCYSGIATEGEKPLPVVGSPVDDTFSHENPNQMGSGWVILASSEKDERSREKLDCTHLVGNDAPHGHGLFTFHLLEGLSGKAGDGKGRITLSTLKQYVGKSLANDKMSFLGAGVGQADEIVIATASELGNLETRLDAVDRFLGKQEKSGLFKVIRESGELCKIAPNLERLNDLVVRTDPSVVSRQGQ